jgi:hypothetical protein
MDEPEPTIADVLQEVRLLRVEFQGVRDGLTGVQAEVTGLRDGLTGVQAEVTGLRDGLTGLREGFHTFLESFRMFQGEVRDRFRAVEILIAALDRDVAALVRRVMGEEG